MVATPYQRIVDEKEKDVRIGNILAAKAVADTVRTSLGPRGMDKMIQDGKGGVLITNDGATLLKKMEVQHPAASMLVQLSKSQDIEAGDGTTSVVVLAGALLQAAHELLERGIHPQTVTEAFLKAQTKAEEILKGMSVPVNLDDKETLVKACTTCLGSKVVSQHSELLAPMAYDAVNKIRNKDNNQIDLNDIKTCCKLGATVDESEMIDGMVLSQKISSRAGGIDRVDKAKIGLIQFCLSPPKTDMEQNVVVNDYTAMDRILKEERKYLLKLVKQISQTGCNVLLIQKSILRDAVTDVALHFLAKMNILVVRDIERDDIEWICKMTGCTPAADIETFRPECLGEAENVHGRNLGEGLGSIVRFTGLKNPGRGVSILLRASNQLMLDETDRSLHDALCVMRSFVKLPFLIPGGGAPEMELSHQLSVWAKTLSGMDQICVRRFAEALEVIPYTLSENAGLTPIKMVTQLRHAHATGQNHSGINVRKGTITNMTDESVVQPLLVSVSSIKMATETVRMILKIDDLVPVR